jgi:hypothetical protein
MSRTISCDWTRAAFLLVDVQAADLRIVDSRELGAAVATR